MPEIDYKNELFRKLMVDYEIVPNTAEVTDFLNVWNDLKVFIFPGLEGEEYYKVALVATPEYQMGGVYGWKGGVWHELFAMSKEVAFK